MKVQIAMLALGALCAVVAMVFALVSLQERKPRRGLWLSGFGMLACGVGFLAAGGADGL